MRRLKGSTPTKKEGAPQDAPKSKHSRQHTESLNALRAVERDRAVGTLRRAVVRAEAVGGVSRRAALAMLALATRGRAPKAVR